MFTYMNYQLVEYDTAWDSKFDDDESERRAAYCLLAASVFLDVAIMVCTVILFTFVLNILWK